MNKFHNFGVQEEGEIEQFTMSIDDDINLIKQLSVGDDVETDT